MKFRVRLNIYGGKKLPELHGAVPAIERVDLEAPVVFTRQLAQADRVQPSGLSQPIS